MQEPIFLTTFADEKMNTNGFIRLGKAGRRRLKAHTLSQLPMRLVCQAGNIAQKVLREVIYAN